MDTSFDISINISVSIPIIGDSSIMLAQPPAGFEFKEIPIDEYIYRNRITDSRGEVMPEYRSAIHSGEKPYVICMEMTNVQTVKHDKPANAVYAHPQITKNSRLLLNITAMSKTPKE